MQAQCPNCDFVFNAPRDSRDEETTALRARVAELEAAIRAALDTDVPGRRMAEMERILRAALEGGDPICDECGTHHAPHANTLCSR